MTSATAVAADADVLMTPLYSCVQSFSSRRCGRVVRVG